MIFYPLPPTRRFIGVMFILLCALVAIASMWVMPAYAQKITTPRAKQVSVDTSASGNSISELVGGACNCSFEVSTISSTKLCLGTPDLVDCTTDYRAVCNGSSCPSNTVSIVGEANEWALISSSGTVTDVWIVCGSGC